MMRQEERERSKPKYERDSVIQKKLFDNPCPIDRPIGQKFNNNFVDFELEEKKKKLRKKSKPKKVNAIVQRLAGVNDIVIKSG